MLTFSVSPRIGLAGRGKGDRHSYPVPSPFSTLFQRAASVDVYAYRIGMSFPCAMILAATVTG